MAHTPAAKAKPKAKHPASDHLRAAADALDAMHQQMAQQPMAPQPGPGAPGPMPPGVSPLGGLAR